MELSENMLEQFRCYKSFSIICGYKQCWLQAVHVQNKESCSKNATAKALFLRVTAD